MFLLLVAGLGTGRWEFYFLFTTLFFLTAVALGLSLWTFYSFSCLYELGDVSAEKGDIATLKIHVTNNAPFPLSSIRAAVQTVLPYDTEELIINIPPRDMVCYEVSMTCKYRGMYEVGITTLEVVDMFGILHMRFDLRRLPNYRLKKLVVYPRVLQLDSTGISASDGTMLEGVSAQHQSDGGEEYYDTRLYRFGDAFKRIHRILSVRKRELHVKRYDIPMEASAIIFIDTCESGFEGEDALRYNDIACECAVAAVNHCLLSGHIVTLVSSDESESIIEGKSPNDLQKIIDYLAVIEFDAQGDINLALRYYFESHANFSTFYVITSRKDKQISDTLSAISQSGRQILLFAPSLGETLEDDKINFADLDLV
ncbi:MAG: DUF58 domain-containing protein [Oscillospiraceae bacterium]|nr:DUF58 domain-containing protein [Oscillospiraceae bacterium]MCL2277818.1 DUF58 domain-containing protein [Oscillospiraceae bacterium]